MIERTWKKVMSNLYTKRTYIGEEKYANQILCWMIFGKVGRHIWILMSLRTNLVLPLKIDIVKLVVQGTGPSKRTGGSKSTVEHIIKLVSNLIL